MKMKQLILLLFFLFFCREESLAGRYAASFLQIGVGARMLGMGSAAMAVSGDVSDFYWNPAGLAGISSIRAQLMYASQFGGFGAALGNYHHGGLVLPVKKGAVLAFNWLHFSVNDIPIFPELEGRNMMQRLQNPAIRPNGTPLGYFQDNENAYYISFAKMNRFILDFGWRFFKIPIEMPIGFNFKIIQADLHKEHASGLGFDFGTMLKFNVNDLLFTHSLGHIAVGLFVKDAAQTTITWSTRHRDTIERNVNWGISYEQPIKNAESLLLVAFSQLKNPETSNRMGVEWKLFSRVFLRSGICDKHFTAGAGLLLSAFRIDYAFASHELGYCHRISVDINVSELFTFL